MLTQRNVHLYPLAEDPAEAERLGRREISRFRDVIAGLSVMEGYFSRAHLGNLQSFSGQAQQAIVTLSSGMILEVIDIPTMEQRAMGFHLFNVFDPANGSDRDGTLVGYSIYSVRFTGSKHNEAVEFNRAESVGLAFDIFQPYRSNRNPAVRFDRHELYNVSRGILYRRFRPERFTLDAKTQVRETRTGDPIKRAGYYLKRGYYPPDNKVAADHYLVDVILKGKRLTPRQVARLHGGAHCVEWVFPVRVEPARAEEKV